MRAGTVAPKGGSASDVLATRHCLLWRQEPWCEARAIEMGPAARCMQSIHGHGNHLDKCDIKAAAATSGRGLSQLRHG